MSHTLKTRDLEGLQEPACVLMPSVGVLTCEHMNSVQVPDPQAMNINTVVSLLLATQGDSQPCWRVHLFAMSVLYTTAQTMNESAITEARKLLVTRILLCVPGSGTKSCSNDFGTRSGHHGA